MISVFMVSFDICHGSFVIEKRSISTFSLLLSSVSAILGSGWLFAAYFAGQYAGPAAILSWILGGAAIICIAFVFVEICTLIPISGSSVRIPQFTHGTIISYLFAWIVWLCYMSFIPTETQAVIQYASFYFPNLTHTSGALTSHGYIVATFIMLLVSIINTYSIRWLIKFNNFITILKIVVPTGISILLLVLYFSFHKMTHFHSLHFLQHGLHGVVYAVAAGGIIFSFNGFKQAAEMAGEAKNPKKSIPIAIVGSVVICLIMFLLLQTSFFSALLPINVVNGKIVLSHSASPFATIISEHHLSWILPLVYVAAILAPLAASMMYCAAAARSLYGMSTNGHIPSAFKKLNAFGNPIYSIIAGFGVGMILFAPLPGWNKMAEFLTSLIAVTYVIGPINLMTLRKQFPNRRAPFHLPFGKIWAAVAFYLCNLFLYWCGWQIISMLGLAIGSGFIFLFAYHLYSRKKQKMELNWFASLWLWPYLVGLSIISYLGNFQGHNIIPFGWDFVVIAIFSVFIIWCSAIFKLPASKTKEYLDNLNLNTNEEH